VNSQGGKEQKMRKLLKSKKALSPVVAAIILIAVTVAVSIAVAAWMGSLTIGFMETSELTITEITFDTTNNNMTVALTNSGTSEVTISLVKVNGNTIASGSVHGDATYDLTFDAGASGSIVIDLTSITAGNKYAINFFATDGTLIGSFTDTA
jgi:flagellin-like protein